ncbi:MAG: ATP-binding protein [Eubacteriales bacterium]|nr:ATP-binding protein [Clostridiales bacterium]MDY5836899.1 ATP-binding protein [Eubacteriales bacterium]
MTLPFLPDTMLVPFFVMSLILLMGNIQITVALVDLKPGAKVIASRLAVFVFCFLAAQVLAEIGSGQILVATWFSDLSWYALASFLVIVFMLEIIFWRMILRKRSNTMGHNAIKESLDNLPDGLCFSKLDGTPLLVNRVMQEISYEVFGKWLVNDLACRDAIRNNKITSKTRILQSTPLVVETPHKIWLIQVLEHEKARETLAYDISQEWAILGEIQEKNAEIEALNAWLKDYHKKVTVYTRQKEILQAKINIHDKIGQSLIYFKHYLAKDYKTEEDRKNLVQLWTESLLVLEDKEEKAETRSSWARLLATARAIGVEIQLEGSLTQSDPDLAILVSIIHEALNNAIRHGQAKNVWIQCQEDALKNYCRIRNDGQASPEVITEKGGLKNMRERLNRLGGNLTITTRPYFELAITWPKGASHAL